MRETFPTPPEMLTVKTRDKYPWRTMNVGESFKIMHDDMKFKHVLNYVYRMNKKFNRLFRVKNYPEHNGCIVALIEDYNIVKSDNKPRTIMDALDGK